MPGRVMGKVALVTGAARGQGRSHSVRLAEEGADIIALDICDTIPGTTTASEEDLSETVRLVEATDRRIIAGIVDVRDRPSLKLAIDAGVHELGRLDIVVANAGIGYIRSWEDVTADVWDTVIGVNLSGVWNTAQLAARHLIDAGGGSMILTSSAAGISGQPFLAPYVAAKHGVVGIMRSLAMELAEHSIRVNSIHPCGVDTPMVSATKDEMDRLIAAHPRLGGIFTNLLNIELIEPLDVSNVVLFLASDDARFITASTVTVDAGNTAY